MFKNKSKKGIKLFIVLLLMSIVVTGCTKDDETSAIFEDIVVDEDGESSEGDKDKPKQTLDEDGNIIDEADNSYKTDLIGQERVNTIYREQLNKRSIKTFDEIEKALSETRDSVVLKTVIPENELQKIMNIMLLDKPEFFYLSNRYSYEIDENGNAISVYFNYMHHKDFVGLDKKYREDHLENIRTEYPFGTTKKEVVDTLYKERAGELSFPKLSMDDDTLEEAVLRRFTSTPSVAKLRGRLDDKGKYPPPIKDDYYSYINKPYLGGSSNERFAVLSQLSDELRELGIENSLMLGEFVSYDLTGEYIEKIYHDDFGELEDETEINYYIPKFIHHDKVNKVERNGNKVDVSVNYYNAHPWLVVKINNRWYNIDPVLDVTVKEYIEQKFGREIVVDAPLFSIVPDIMISGTRITNYTEEVLGISPACQSSEESDRILSDNTITKSGVGYFYSDAKDRLVSLRGERSNGALLLSFTNPLDIEAYDNALRSVAEEEDVLEVQGLNRFKTAILRDLNLYIIYDYEK